VKAADKAALEAFYANTRARMQSAWEAQKDDAALKAGLAKAIHALSGTASEAALTPSAASLSALLLAGFSSLLALFGLGGLIGFVRDSKRS
jgi:hypothetical protein